MAASPVSLPPATSASSLPISSLPSAISNSSTSISFTSIVSATGSPDPLSTSLLPTSASTVPVTQSESSTIATTSATSIPVKAAILTTPQIAGIAVAGAASAAFAFGLLVCLFCLRKKRRIKRQSESLPFTLEKSPPKPLSRPSTPEDKPADPGFSFTVANGEQAAASRSQFFGPLEVGGVRRSFLRKSIKPEEIGVAVSPEMTQGESPASATSQRTISQLLPEKPNFSLFPAPSRTIQQHVNRNGARPESTATEFEEDFVGRRSLMSRQGVARDERQRPLGEEHLYGLGLPPNPRSNGPGFTQPQAARHRPINDPGLPDVQNSDSRGAYLRPPGLPSDPRARMYAMERERARPQQQPQRRPYFPPPPVYDNGNVRLDRQWTPPSRNMPRPPPQALIHPPSLYPGSIINDYLEPPADSSRAPSSSYSRTHSLPPSELRHNVNSPQPFPSSQNPTVSNVPDRAIRHPSASRRDSAASTTSFGTVIDDEDTTPEQELPAPKLTTVIESPTRNTNAAATADEAPSPIKDLRYPPMPRSASLAKQATKPSFPRAAQFVSTQGSPVARHPPRDHLVANEESFLRGPSTRTSSPTQRSDSPSSLLAKRRGDRAAENMEQGLRLRNDTNKPGKWRVVPDEEGKIGERDVAGAENKSPQRPVWERKLTPTRRGDDLYLSVD